MRKKIDREKLPHELVERVSMILRTLEIPYIVRTTNSRYECHLAFKISPRNAILFLQYLNKVNPKDKIDIYFKLAKNDNPVKWAGNWKKQGKNNKWIDRFVEVWRKGYPPFLQYQGKGSLYGLQVEISDLGEGFDELIIPFIRAAYAQATKDQELYDCIRKGTF